MIDYDMKYNKKERLLSRRIVTYGYGNFSSSPPPPLDMSLDLLASCNHQCLFCPNRKKKKAVAVMPLELASSILRQASELRVREVGLYGQGEPLLVPDFYSYVAEAKKYGFTYIYLTTNGVLLNPSTLDRCLDAGLNSIKFSINGYGRKQYHFVHGRDDFDQVVENLEHLIEVAAKRPVRVFISCVVSDYSQGALEALQQRYGSRVDEVVGYDCTTFNGLSLENIGILTPKIASGKAPCPWPFSRMAVTPEGYLSACCGDIQNYLAVADLRVTPLAEAWHSPHLIRLRERHLVGDLRGTLCHNCLTNTQETILPLCSPLCSPVDQTLFNSPTVLHGLLEQRSNQTAKALS